MSETDASEIVVESQCKGVATTDNPYRGYTWMQLHDCLIEKDYQLECMSDSVQRLTALEAEEKRKNELISDLRRELAAYKKNSRHKDFSFVSLEEHLASCEAHLQQKSTEADTFRLELEELKGQLHTTAQERSSLQQKLSSKSATLASLTAEVKGLQRQTKLSEEEMATLRQTAQERMTKISSLQSSVKRLRASCQETQKRFEMSESENKILQEKEARTRAELERLKGQHHATIIAQLQARQRVLEQELDRTRGREGTLSSELNSVCEQVVRLTQCDCSSVSSEAAVVAVSSLAEQCALNRQQVETLARQLEEKQVQHSALSSTLSELTQCLEEFKGSCEGENGGRVCPCLQSLISRLQTLHCNMTLTTNLETVLMESLDVVNSTLCDVTTKWTQLTQQLTEGCSTIEECKDKEEPFHQLSSLVSSHQSLLAESREVQERLSTKEVEHSAALSGALTALRLENQLRIEETVERIKQEERECHERDLKGVKKAMEGEREMAISEEKRNTEAVREELHRTKQLLEEKEIEVIQMTALEKQVTELQSALSALEQSKAESLCVAEEQSTTLREHMQSEVDSYKEQSQQYALTIAAMEEKLLALMHKLQLLQTENDSLKEQAQQQQTRVEQSREDVGELEKLEQLAKTLRHQLALSIRESEQHQNKIQELEKVIESKSHTEDELKAQHTSELEDMRKTLSSQENMVESQRQDLCQLKGELAERSSELTSLREQCRRREEETAANWRQQREVAEREAKESSEQLLAVGERCLGEHHSQVLARQRDTLAHLRQQLQDREDGRPTDASHEATLAELQRVREELVEERAKRHLEGGAGGEGSHAETGMEPDPVIDALQCSEDSYFKLMGSVCEGGFMKRGAEVKMPVTTRQDDRHSLMEERRKFADKVAKRIKAMVKQEKDTQQNTSILSASDDESSQSDSETVTRLRTELESAHEELEQQKRLNFALVRRKEFHEQQEAKVSGFRR